ncbi:hypothetical protein J7E62_08320 [Variovorax paradoxus]|nr:hypothetical protein [Variovorax paradoxus]
MMRVYGDVVRRGAADDVLEQLRERLAGASAAGPGLHRHGLLVGALIQAGQLAQGLADLRFAAAGGRDEPSPVIDAALALTRMLAANCALSWNSDFARIGALPEVELAACAALLPHEAIELKEPEGYAFYALYPESYLNAAQRLRGGSWQVFGIRSIGTSLGAIVASELGARRLVTLRPAGHPFARSVAADALQVDPGASAFAVVDEGPGLSGSSMAAVAQWLCHAGVAEDRIHFFAGHANGPGREASNSTRDTWKRVRLHVADFEQAVLRAQRPAQRLESWVETLVGPLHAPLQDISGGRWRGLQARDTSRLPPVHAARERRKFLATAASGRWLVKFIGLGREGERKFARAQALAAAGFCPRPAGLCHGFIVERWRDDLKPLPRPLQAEQRARLVERIGDYLAYRSRSFPASDSPGASPWELWEMGCRNTEAAFGLQAALAWRSWRPMLDPLARALRRVETDNRMHAWEWLAGDGLILKTDAVDHHAGHELVGCQDLAWDIAGAAVEFDLCPAEVQQLLDRCGHRPDTLALQFNRLCYLAFELGRHHEALASGADDDAALHAAVERYGCALQAELGAPPRV